MTEEGPLERARRQLLDAKAKWEHSPSAANLLTLTDAQVHMDFLLDTLPLVSPKAPPLTSPVLEALLPHTPTGPGASSPGPVVPFFVVGGEHDDEVSLDELLGEGDDDA